MFLLGDILSASLLFLHIPSLLSKDVYCQFNNDCIRRYFRVLKLSSSP